MRRNLQTGRCRSYFWWFRTQNSAHFSPRKEREKSWIQNDIRQTKQTLEQRDKRHLSQLNDNTYFHRALQKYGRENFLLELIEDNIPFSELDEKEKFYIDKFNSFYTTGKGYNLTQGG